MNELAEWFSYEGKYCLFCGAGFSKWAVGLPTAYELFDFKIRTYGIRESSKLKKIQDFKIKWDKEHPSGKAEEFIGYSIDHPTEYEKLVVWYIARRLAEPFIEKDDPSMLSNNEVEGRRLLAINEKRKFKREGVKKATDFINYLSGPYLEGIITTNYDLLLEYTLGTKKFFYGGRSRLLYGPRRAYAFPGDKKPVNLKGSLPLVKLHGSVSLTEKGYCADSRGCITGKAIIIPPAHNKKVSDLLIPEWAYARQILKNSKKIIFFGFRFNDYDQELLALLRETEPWMKEIILINQNSDVKMLAKKIWPSAKIKLIHPRGLNEQDLNFTISDKNTCEKQI
jgi:hypothetical protein